MKPQIMLEVVIKLAADVPGEIKHELWPMVFRMGGGIRVRQVLGSKLNVCMIKQTF